MPNPARYTVRIPVSRDPRLDNQGLIITRHRTWSGAVKSWRRQAEAAATKPGGYGAPYIYDDEEGTRVPPHSRAPMLDAKLNAMFRAW